MGVGCTVVLENTHRKMSKIFKYIEPMWLGKDDQISIRRVLAIAFSIDYITNNFYAIHHWNDNSSFAELSSLLMIEAGLIAALLALTTWQTINSNDRSNNSSKNQDSPS